MKLLPLVLLALSLTLRAELTEEQKRNPLEVDSTDPKLAKIVLLAGPTSHAGGAHEYFAGCALMADLLKQTPGVFPVLIGDGWPKNEAVLDGAKSVVIYMDAGAKFPLLEPARWAKLKSLMEKGTGLVVLHQSMDIPADHADELQKWAGAAFVSDIGCRGHWDLELSEVAKSPVTRGIEPFPVPGDGWLYNMHFAPEAKSVIASVVPDKSRSSADAKTHMGRAETLAWTYERPDGGRGFGFTGGDLHKNWGLVPQRKLVVNGILWTAGVEVPAAGAPVEMKDDALTKNMDTKPKAAAKEAKAAQ